MVVQKRQGLFYTNVMENLNHRISHGVSERKTSDEWIDDAGQELLIVPFSTFLQHDQELQEVHTRYICRYVPKVT